MDEKEFVGKIKIAENYFREMFNNFIDHLSEEYGIEQHSLDTHKWSNLDKRDNSITTNFRYFVDKDGQVRCIAFSYDQSTLSLTERNELKKKMQIEIHRVFLEKKRKEKI